MPVQIWPILVNLNFFRHFSGIFPGDHPDKAANCPMSLLALGCPLVLINRELE